MDLNFCSREQSSYERKFHKSYKWPSNNDTSHTAAFNANLNPNPNPTWGYG